MPEVSASDRLTKIAERVATGGAALLAIPDLPADVISGIGEFTAAIDELIGVVREMVAPQRRPDIESLASDPRIAVSNISPPGAEFLAATCKKPTSSVVTFLKCLKSGDITFQELVDAAKEAKLIPKQQKMSGQFAADCVTSGVIVRVDGGLLIDGARYRVHPSVIDHLKRS